MKKILLISMSALLASNAFATLINFDDLAVDTILSNQYAGQGVTFAAGHNQLIPGLTTGSTGAFATNTTMDIVSATGSNVGGLGTPTLVSGNLLRGFSGWLSEDGDASFTMTFTNAISAVSLDFAGVATANVSGLYAISGGSVVASAVVGAGTGQATLNLAGLNVTEVVVLPGDFNDWVGVDNLNFTEAVPEPATMVVLAGAALAAASRRRKK